MKKLVIAAVLSLIFKGYALENYLGLTPKDAINSLGSPDYIFTQRGNLEVEDDVVFFYDNRLYLYFNGNRVWQVRLDGEYEGESNGLTMGITTEEVKEIMGEPIFSDDESIVYRWKDYGYPTLIRLFFNDSKLDDLYFYRGDY